MSADGYTVDLEASGTTAPGDVIDIDISGGPANATLVVYFTAPVYGMHQGSILVPSTSRSFIETFDGNGEANLQLIWPAVASAGSELAIQVDTRTPNNLLSRSNAFIGTTMTAAEAAAFTYAEVASSGWQNIDVTSVEEALTITNQAELQTGLDLIVDAGSYPDAFEDGLGHSFYLSTLGQAGISSGEIAAFRADMGAYVTLGDTIVKVSWDHSSLGSFESYSVFDGSTSGLILDGFEFMMPDVFPKPLGTTQAGTFRTTPVDVGSEWFFGYQARVTGEVAVGCDSSGNVQSCSMNATSISPAPTWEADHQFECNTGASDNCCYCTFNVAMSSGFKSINAGGAGGFTLSGNIGYGFNKSYAMKGCCQ